jgi:PRTRC genetic system protein C
MSIKKTERVFLFKDKRLPDLGEHLTPEEVMGIYANQYPSLTNGEIGGPYYEEGEERWKLEGKTQETYKMRGSYGTKG